MNASLHFHTIFEAVNKTNRKSEWKDPKSHVQMKIGSISVKNELPVSS